MIVTKPQNDGSSVVDSYLIYACRSLNDLAAPYTTELLQPTLTDYSNADIQGGRFRFRKRSIFYTRQCFLAGSKQDDDTEYLLWFYLETPGKHEYTTQTAYVIISAIDGSIYNPWLGTLEPSDNNQTNK